MHIDASLESLLKNCSTLIQAFNRTDSSRMRTELSVILRDCSLFLEEHKANASSSFVEFVELEEVEFNWSEVRITDPIYPTNTLHV